MKTGKLLEQLILIAQVTKTDFALGMNMTPSGLSKILTGKRLPFVKEKQSFSKQAARYLAGLLYAPGCYLKFERLFPFIYDFASKQELDLFLSHAIEYALDEDFAVENSENLDYPAKEIAHLGKREVLNHFCLIMSDLAVDSGGALLEFCSTLPYLRRDYADIFGRIRFNSTKRMDNVRFNHYFVLSTIEAYFNEFEMRVLSSIVALEDHMDMHLWMVEENIEHRFLLAKGRFLLVFSIQLDGTPMMAVIANKGYLAMFYSKLTKLSAKKISYSTEEATAFLEENPGYLQTLAERGIDAVYNAISIGYMLGPQDFPLKRRESPIVQSMLALFGSILKADTIFYVTVDAMLNISETGKAVVPLVGTVDFPPSQRIPYLQRLQQYTDHRSSSKIRIISDVMPKIVVLCAQNLSIVYLFDEASGREKIHCFETGVIRTILDGDLAMHGVSPLDFSLDLWDTFIAQISKNLIQ